MKKIILYTLCMMYLTSMSCIAQERVSYTYPNGNKQAEGTYTEGEKDGLWVEWNEDGSLKEEKLYKNGHILEEKSYTTQGSLSYQKFYHQHPSYTYERRYFNSILSDETYTKPDVTIKNSFYKNGAFRRNFYSYKEDSFDRNISVPTIELYEDGTVAMIICGTNSISWYKDKTLKAVSGYFYSGTTKYWYRWDELGRRIDNNLNVIENDTCTFNKSGIENKLQFSLKDNRPHGIWRDYYTNGQLWFEIEYDNGVPVGDYKSYYFDGTPQIQTHFTNGFFDGKYTEWYENGNKKKEGWMNLHSQDSTWKYWNKNGFLTEEKTYKNKRLNGWEYKYYAQDTLSYLKFYKGNGYHIYEKNFYRNGHVNEISYKNIGLNISFYENGDYRNFSGKVFKVSWNKDKTLLSIIYSENKKSAYLYFENGVPKTKELWLDGIKSDSIAYTWMNPPNGKMILKQVGDSINGKREGKWEIYYPTGNLWIEMHYKNDLLDGEYIERSIDGQIVQLVHLKDGLRNGMSESWTTTGEKLTEENYLNDLKNGVQKEWTMKKNYYLASISNYSNDTLNGAKYQFGENGDTIFYANYRNGERDGICKTYDRDEHYLSEAYTYKNDKKNGDAFIYSKEGYILWKGSYHNDRRHGEWTQYNEKGKKISTVLYEYGNIIQEPTELECQCTANYGKVADMKFAQAISTFVDYQPFYNTTNKYFIVPENKFDQLFCRNHTFSGSTTGSFEQLDIVALDTLWFETLASKGLRFVVNPCLTINQYSSTQINVTSIEPIRRYMDIADFDYKAYSFFELALEVYFENRGDNDSQLFPMLVNFVAKTESLSVDESYLKIKELLKEENIEIQMSENYNQFLSLSATDNEAFGDNFWDHIIVKKVAKKYFNFGEIKIDSLNPDFESRFNTFFENAFSFREFYNYFSPTYSADTDIKRLAIDFPKEILTRWDVKSNSLYSYNGNTLGARLLLTSDPISFNNKRGFELENQKEFCFTPAAIGGKKCILKTNEAEVIPQAVNFSDILNTKFYNGFLIEKDTTNDKYKYDTFISENGYNDFAGVYIKNGFGSIKIGGKEVDILYKNVFISGTYILGEIELPHTYIGDRRLKQIQKRYFPICKIETSTKEKTILYFLLNKE